MYFNGNGILMHNGKKENGTSGLNLNSLYKYSYKHKYRINVNRIGFYKTSISLGSQKVEKESITKIKQFPLNNNYFVSFHNNYYDIYNRKTGKKLSTQKSNDKFGFQGIVTLPGERILAVGVNFIKAFHYNLSDDNLNFIEIKSDFPTNEKAIYIRLITNNYLLLCKRTLCYIFNIDKNVVEKTLYLKSFLKLLHIKNEINASKDYFSNCKIFSKNEFGLCYKNLIFLLHAPEGFITSYIELTDYDLNTKIYMKRMILNLEKNVKRFYMFWDKNRSEINVYTKKEKDKNEEVLMNQERNIILFDKEKKIYNIKQSSNYEMLVMTQDNDIFIYNFICNGFIT